ncbi:hypothetical protein Trydic_g17632 [Trypoxylus dichotomus]
MITVTNDSEIMRRLNRGRRRGTKSRFPPKELNGPLLVLSPLLVNAVVATPLLDKILDVVAVATLILPGVIMVVVHGER